MQGRKEHALATSHRVREADETARQSLRVPVKSTPIFGVHPADTREGFNHGVGLPHGKRTQIYAIDARAVFQSALLPTAAVRPRPGGEADTLRAWKWQRGMAALAGALLSAHARACPYPRTRLSNRLHLGESLVAASRSFQS